jgi:putative PIN family toxin of toxin-antitoxin system
MKINSAQHWIVVFDTNILLSAIFSETGSPFFCLKLAKQGGVQSVTCQEILNEFQEKLEGKFRWDLERTQEALNEIRNISQIITITGNLKGVSPDPDDDMILECAVVGNATHIVTGDKRLLSLGSYQNILLVKPTDFLTIVSQSQN